MLKIGRIVQVWAESEMRDYPLQASKRLTFLEFAIIHHEVSISKDVVRIQIIFNRSHEADAVFWHCTL